MSDLLKPCIKCGVLGPTTTCPDHTIISERYPKDSPRKRGYTSAWDKLSRRARRLQPFCTNCGTKKDLTLDHSTEAWEAHDAGKPITMSMVQVLCRPCNARKGPARPEKSHRTPASPTKPSTDDEGDMGPSKGLRTPWARHSFSYTPKGYAGGSEVSDEGRPEG